MKYLSAKETAKKWGLGMRSVQNFCASGKIPGAKNLGKQWLIPADSVRPTDSRFKGAPPHSAAYRFPLFVCSPAYACSDTFNPNERTLFSAQLKQLEGDYYESIAICRELLDCDLPCHLKMGAYYNITICSILLGNHFEYKTTLETMINTVSPDDIHIEDYKLMIASIKRIIGWNHNLFDDIDIRKLSSDALYMYQYECLLGVIIADGNISNNALHIYDALARQVSFEGIEPLEANLRFPLASLHMLASDPLAEEHIAAGCNILISNNWMSLFGKNLTFASALIKKYLDENKPGYFKKASELSERDMDNWRIVNQQESGVYPLENFSPKEISLLFMLHQGMTNKQICTVMDLSPNALQKIIKSCCETANLKSRTELKQYALSHYSTWYKNQDIKHA